MDGIKDESKIIIIKSALAQSTICFSNFDLLDNGEGSKEYNPTCRHSLPFMSSIVIHSLIVLMFDIACCIKSKKNICIYEAHANISYDGRDKIIFEFNARCSWISRFVIEIFI